MIRTYDVRKISKHDLDIKIEADEREARQRISRDVQRKTRWEGYTLVVEWIDPLVDQIARRADRIAAANTFVENYREGRGMGKLQEVAQRIAKTKQTLEAEADKLLTRLDGIDRQAPEAFARSNAILDQHKTDLDSMESELRQLSNVPLG